MSKKRGDGGLVQAGEIPVMKTLRRNSHDLLAHSFGLSKPPPSFGSSPTPQ